MTTASAGLVAHDVYHHQPSDHGTFAQEVAALGAEWYLDIQQAEKNDLSSWSLAKFERNVVDSVLNAIDTAAQGFALHSRACQALSLPEMHFFGQMARKAFEVLKSGDVALDVLPAEFEQLFVEELLWGFRQAQERFPDQAEARQGSRQLVRDLVELDLGDVPYGHEITIRLNGHQAVVDYTDADADFLSQHNVMPAVMMTWCSCVPGFPEMHTTVHATARDYASYVDDHFKLEDELDLDEEQRLIPQGEQSALTQVYVLDGDLRTQLMAGRAVTLPIGSPYEVTVTPRGVRFI